MKARLGETREPEELVRAGARTRSENFAMDGIKIERSSGRQGSAKLHTRVNIISRCRSSQNIGLFFTGVSKVNLAGKASDQII